MPVVPVELFDALMATAPREDRNLAAQMLDGFGADRFRTALGRACKAAGVLISQRAGTRKRRRSRRRKLTSTQSSWSDELCRS